MYHHDAAHTGYSNGTAPTTLPAQLWNYTLELDTSSSTPHSPAVVDGFVYVDSEYNLSCFDASTGANIWNFPVVSYADSAPAVVNGRVYVGSVNGGVYSLDASSGVQVWNYSTGNSFDSSPTVVNDLVYVESSNGGIYCLDTANGNRVWNFSTGSTASGASPAVSGGYVYVGNEGGGVFCLDASNGGVVWNVTVNGAVGSPAFSNGCVYLGSTDGNVYCLNASNGAKVWNYTTEYNSNGPTHGYHWGNTVSDPAVAYGKVYVGSSDFLVYCLTLPQATKSGTTPLRQKCILLPQLQADAFWRGLMTVTSTVSTPQTAPKYGVTQPGFSLPLMQPEARVLPQSPEALSTWSAMASSML